MTEQNRAELQRGLEAVVRESSDTRGQAITHGRRPCPENRYLTETFLSLIYQDRHPADFPEPPPLTTAQQLALSVLLGDDIPLGVLLSACEDAGVFADGLAGEIAEEARAEEREQSAIAAMMLTNDRADELRALPLHEMEAVALDDHAAWLRDRMIERA